MKPLRLLLALALLPLLAACETTSGGAGPQSTAARAAMLEEIRAEPPGAYYVGRRYYKTDYKFWGFIRQSGQPWSTAKLVVLNENQKFAPDRAAGKLGSDNNYEYKLIGNFSGDMVYEPASNGQYAEFILRGYELRSTNPAPIFRERGATDPGVRIVARPY